MGQRQHHALLQASKQKTGLDARRLREWRWLDLRVHQGLRGIPNPDPAIAERPERGRLVARPVLGGLHHDYRLAA